MKKPEFQTPERRRAKIIEHSFRESRKNIQDKKFRVIEDDDEIDRILAGDLDESDYGYGYD